MAEFDAGFKIVARAAGRELTRIAGYEVSKWEPIPDTVQTTERLADRAFRAQGASGRFVVYFEAYTRWVESAPWSVLSKSGLLSERERLPTVSLVFVLLPQGYREQGETFRLEAEGGPTQQVWFREVCLWKEQPQPWWEHFPGLMPLYPLCGHGQKVPEAITHAAETIRRRELDNIRRGDLLTTLGIFGKLADRKLDAMSLIGREHMKDSPFYQELVAEGREEGKQLGIRTAVLQLLEIRFGPEATSEFEGTLNGIENLEQLAELHRLAATSRRISQFRRALSNLETPGGPAR